MQQRDEDKLQAALWELICLRKMPGVLAYAVVNNPRSAPDGARLKRLGMLSGVPDLHFVVAPHGRLFTLEIKTKKGRLSDNQITWMNSLSSHGAVADVGYGWDECVHILKIRNLIKHGTYGRFFSEGEGGSSQKGPKKPTPAVRPSLEPGELSPGNAVPIATRDDGAGNPRRVQGSGPVGGQPRRNEPKNSLQSASVPLAGSDDPKGPSI